MNKYKLELLIKTGIAYSRLSKAKNIKNCHYLLTANKIYNTVLKEKDKLNDDKTITIQLKLVA